MSDSAMVDSSPSTLAGLLDDPSLGAKTLMYRSAAVLYEAGSPAEHLYYIHEGQIRLYQVGPRGEDRLVEIYGPGNWCCIEALANPASHPHRAVVISRAKITLVPTDPFLKLLSQYPSLVVGVIRCLAGKVQSARDEAGRLVFDDCDGRLLKTLIRFSDSAAASPAPGGVDLHITHRQLAEAVGVARETISLALTQFRRRNLLSTGRNRLSFDPDQLRRYLNPPAA
jgi:CRP/FNR family transcriptional regulator